MDSCFADPKWDSGKHLIHEPAEFATGSTTNADEKGVISTRD
jgi:hypothetical protein